MWKGHGQKPDPCQQLILALVSKSWGSGSRKGGDHSGAPERNLGASLNDHVPLSPSLQGRQRIDPRAERRWKRSAFPFPSLTGHGAFQSSQTEPTRQVRKYLKELFRHIFFSELSKSRRFQGKQCLHGHGTFCLSRFCGHWGSRPLPMPLHFPHRLLDLGKLL